MNTIKRATKYLREFSFARYFKGEGRCRFSLSASVSIHKSALLKNCNINVIGNSSVTIGKDVKLFNADIYVEDGCFVIEDKSIVEGTSISLDPHCRLQIGHNSRLSAKRVWMRFGSSIAIGAFTNINHDSEIRVDESIEIGSYCQISQYVNIWDTNTHGIYSPQVRRKLTEDYFPLFGKELARPKTKKIIIGDDCWIGEHASILKGTILGNEVIVGYNTTISNRTIPEKKTVVQDIQLKMF